MSDITYNPPPLPEPAGIIEFSADIGWTETQVRQIEAAAFARGVAAARNEKDLLVEELQSYLAGWLAANSPGGWIDELRAKLKALEEQTPVEGVVFCSINGPMRVPRGMEESMCNEEVPRFRLYRAAGAKHD